MQLGSGTRSLFKIRILKLEQPWIPYLHGCTCIELLETNVTANLQLMDVQRLKCPSRASKVQMLLKHLNPWEVHAHVHCVCSTHGPGMMKSQGGYLLDSNLGHPECWFRYLSLHGQFSNLRQLEGWTLPSSNIQVGSAHVCMCFSSVEGPSFFKCSHANWLVSSTLSVDHSTFEMFELASGLVALRNTERAWWVIMWYRLHMGQ